MSDAIPICFAITDLEVGGAERNLVQLVRRLDRKQWSPSVVCLAPFGPLAKELPDDIPVHSLEMHGPGSLVSGLARFRRHLAQVRPALLQTFLFHANVLARFAKSSAGRPILVSGVRVAERGASWHLWLDRLTRSRVDHYVCVSEGVKDFTRRTIGVGADRLSVIPNGVEIEKYEAAAPIDRAAWDIPRDRPLLLFIGRLDPQKGLFDLLEAAGSIQAEHGPDVAQIVFLGEGPMRRQLASEIERRNLGKMVRLVGWQSDIAGWLRAADGMALPSHWEGMPNAILEAMAAARPVIATDIEGSRDLVRPGESGWLVPPKSPALLAQAMAQFFQCADRRSAYGERGQQIARENYSYPIMVERYERLYRSLLAH